MNDLGAGDELRSTPSPLEGEGGREPSDQPGERAGLASGADASPASRTLRIRLAPSPTRGEGTKERVLR
jgi:hypothetical protein